MDVTFYEDASYFSLTDTSCQWENCRYFDEMFSLDLVGTRNIEVENATDLPDDRSLTEQDQSSLTQRPSKLVTKSE